MANRYQAGVAPTAPANSARGGSLNDSNYTHGIHSKHIDPLKSTGTPSVLPSNPQQLPRQTFMSTQYQPGRGPHQQNYPQFLSLVETVSLQLGFLWSGLRDAFRWDLLVKLLVSDVEIRAHMFKSFVLNIIGLVSVYAFDLILMPLFHRTASPTSIVSTSGIYHIVWLLPVVGGSLYLNGIWCSTIAEKVYAMQHGRQHYAAPTTYTGLLTTIASSAYRVILIVTSVSVSFALSYIPVVGSSLSFLFTCWVDSYYCFEFAWQAQGLSLAARVRYLEERWAYFLGFGLPTTALCVMGSSLANAALFALIFPSYIILAMYAKPTPQQPYSPSPPVRSNVTGEEIYPLSSPFIPVRLPIFKLVIWINAWVIRGIDWMTGGGRRSTAPRSATGDGKRWDGEEDLVESGLPLRSPFVSATRSPVTPGLKSRSRME